jgi:hypothetical protein
MLARLFLSWGSILGFSNAPLAREERRSEERVISGIETTCHRAMSSEAPVPIRVRNVSFSGIGLGVGVSFKPGSLVSILVPGDDAAISEVLACVLRCDQTEEGWFLGCTFATPLCQDDLMRFGALPRSLVPAPKPERGGSVGHAKATFTVVGAPPTRKPCSAEVLHLSTSRVILQVATLVVVGELLNLELGSEEGGPTLSILASVGRTTAEPDGTRSLTCSFISELGEDQIQPYL